MSFVVSIVICFEFFVFVSVLVVDCVYVECGEFVVVLLMCYVGFSLVCLCYEWVGLVNVLVVVLVGGIFVYCYVVFNVQFSEKGWVEVFVGSGCVLDLQ